MQPKNLTELFIRLDEIIQSARTPESGRRIYFRRNAHIIDNGDESGIYTNSYERNDSTERK